MPHSTSPSTDTTRTFDLGVDADFAASPVSPVEDEEERPMTSKSQSSSAYGVAVTSQTPPRDERSDLPSQRNSVISARRKSAPGANSYAEIMAQGGPVQDFPILRRDAQRDNRRSLTFTEDSKRRSQHFDNAGSTKEKVQRASPVVAELKTNVIVSWRGMSYYDALPFTNNCGCGVDQRRVHACNRPLATPCTTLPAQQLMYHDQS
jgi:hypothetical protein